jgi:hypothetical protein
MELDEIARAAAAHGEVSGVLAAELPSGARYYLVSFDGVESWLVVDAAAHPVDDRATVREVASLVVMAEIAAEAAGEDDRARIASPAYLDRVGTADLGAATPLVEAFVEDVVRGYKLPLR